MTAHSTSCLIQIGGLKTLFSIGVYAWEKKIRQTVILDLEFEFDFQEACAHDDLNQTMDYTAVEQLVIELAAERHYQLLETLAYAIVQRIHERFKHLEKLKKISLKATKPYALKQAEGAAVFISKTF